MDSHFTNIDSKKVMDREYPIRYTLQNLKDGLLLISHAK